MVVQHFTKTLCVGFPLISQLTVYNILIRFSAIAHILSASVNTVEQWRIVHDFKAKIPQKAIANGLFSEYLFDRIY